MSPWFNLENADDGIDESVLLPQLRQQALLLPSRPSRRACFLPTTLLTAIEASHLAGGGDP